MRLQTLRDNHRAWHLDLIGNGWALDLVTVTAAAVLVTGFAGAIATLLMR